MFRYDRCNRDIDRDHGQDHREKRSFLPTSKKNQRTAFEDVKLFFRDMEENGLYWILDIHFKEDASTANEDNALANLGLLKKIAFNFTKLDPEMAKKSIKKKMADLELFRRLVFEVITDNAISG